MLYWLHQQTADFKAKYIRSMVNIAAPWGGAIKALRLMTSGDNIDVSDGIDRPRRDNRAVLGVRSFHRHAFVPINVRLHRRPSSCPV